ncbi:MULTISPECIES: hypothetical protein [unclassified Bartonella]|uniref:hypothetical protein n=1 Tax=unclassified Bartonella TaxID=2645622 RepID=UPI0035D1302E
MRAGKVYDGAGFHFHRCGGFEGEERGRVLCYQDKDGGRECLQKLLLLFVMFEVV